MTAAAAELKEQPISRTGPEYVDASIAELEKTGGANIREIDASSLAELADSIKEEGILQPVLVVPTSKGLRLVAGFRRVAAAKVARLTCVPARVLELDELEVLESQLVENLQRKDLGALEEARALQKLLETSGLTQEQVGKKIGKSQPYVANRIRLLALPEKGAKLLAAGKLSPSAAEQLVKLPEGADREVKRAFVELERKAAYRGTVSVEEARWAAESARRSYQDRVKKEKTIAAAKFPDCPVKGCGKAGRPPAYWDSGTGFSCSAGHSWSPATGKLAATDSDRQRPSAPPPKPTLPTVDAKVPLAVPAQQVTNRILAAIKNVYQADVRWTSGTRAQLELLVELPSLKGSRVPDIQVDAAHKFVWLPGAEEYYQRDDTGRKRAAQLRANLSDWLKTIGKQKKAGK